MPATTYYALLFAGDTAENPTSILRRVHAEPAPVDEVFGRDDEWHPTAYIALHFMNRLDWDLEEVDEAAARAIINRWTHNEDPQQ